eukprot:9491733-Alexandrium_andersonii.AAC.1
MSASLVGSEMCIRDSIPATRRNLAAGIPCHRKQLGRSSQDGPGGIRRNPVSYTHLTLPTICSV